MLKYCKPPRSVTEFSLMKGVTDFSNLRQFDMYETGYGFLVVCAVPRYMDLLAKQNDKVRALQDGFVHILESEFRGIDGLPDITAEAGTISNGVNELQVINNVTMDTSVQVSMSYYERSGSLLTKYAEYYLRGIKDPSSKAKHYHGLIAGGQVTDPGPDYESFTLLYYATDNTCRNVEKAYLLANAQITGAQTSNLYNMQRSDINFPEVTLTFNAFPITNDQVNLYAAKMLEYQLTTTDSSKRLILDSDDPDYRHAYRYAVYDRHVEGGDSAIMNDLGTVATGTIDTKYASATTHADNNQ